MQKEGLIMHKFDYSFLNRSQLNGNLTLQPKKPTIFYK